ncbi:unnamed protein product [Schistocephalus solidus]|uniref:Uncharacterized protein n=1 Tax=Schistocephalus solidus TaxID=70667 RepID=A0A183TDC9_SCHSO|nr:unnamed protein product [Schistocephalus solidus]
MLFLPSITPQATAKTSGLKKVRVSGFVGVSTPDASAPYPLLFPLLRYPCPLSPLPSPLASRLILLLLPILSPFFSLALLLSFTFTASLLPFSSPFPPPPRSNKSYGDGDMQSRRGPRRIGRSLTSHICW